ncbi:protein LURP-one-related 8-like [Typha latifolia]|uniref:protein LURP-one-related 8-like n=1 Tax=Typha latifolia TaxID=4733 RepID=UPI003C2AE386
MAKVYPNVGGAPGIDCGGGEGERRQEATTLTVWRKSLLFNCNGFTVFDAKGNLVFRVDNYGEDRGEVVLMDAKGIPICTIRRKKLSLVDHSTIYNGEESVNPIFSVKKHVTLGRSKTLAHVTPSSGGACGCGAAYTIEGSYSRRSCAVYDGQRRQVAELSRKESDGGVALGADVFRLVVQPDLDTCLAMAIVVVLDQMFE